MRLSLSFRLFLATVAAAIAAFCACQIAVGGIHSTNTTEADLIRRCCSIRLIQPEWVSSQPDLILNWAMAEIKARLALIMVLWLASVSLIVHFCLKARKGTNDT